MDGHTPSLKNPVDKQLLHKDIDFAQVLTSKGHHTESKASSWGPFYIYTFNVPALMKGDLKKKKKVDEVYI